MNTTDVILDLVQRTRFSLANVRELTEKEITAHPLGHPNSVAWLLWHSGREMDAQFSQLSDSPEVWTEQGFNTRFDLGAIGDSFGYGHSRAEAEKIHITDQSLMTDYVEAVLDQIASYSEKLEQSDWEKAIDQFDGEDITAQVRMTSLLLDAIEHLAQARYIAGMPRLKGEA